MGLVQLFRGNQIKVQFVLNDSQGTVISLDASMAENHTRESPPSEFEIESGTTISDNIIVKPFGLEITGIISDTPLSLTGELLTTAVSLITPPAGLISVAAGAAAGSAIVSAIGGSSSRSQSAYEQLLAIQNLKQPFTVITSLKQYQNMWVKSLSVPRTPETGQVLQFTISLVQLMIVSPQTVNLQILGNPDANASEADAGKQGLTKAANGFVDGHTKEIGLVRQTARNLIP